MPTLIPHAKLALLLKQDRVVSSARTVGELLDEVARRLPENEWLAARKATLLVNGRNVNYLAGQKTALEADDEVWMVVPSGGG